MSTSFGTGLRTTSSEGSSGFAGLRFPVGQVFSSIVSSFEISFFPLLQGAGLTSSIFSIDASGSAKRTEQTVN